MRRLPVLLLLAACGGTDPDERGGPWIDAHFQTVIDAAPTDGQPDADPYCHYDCFGFIECHDGVVTDWGHTPVPCEYWDGQCPIDAQITCAEGCAIEGATVYYDPFYDPSVFCAEHPPAAAGDPCWNDWDCRPDPTTVAADGSITTTYLGCDWSTDQCAEIAPPVIPDLLAPCPNGASGQAGSGHTGYLNGGNGCSGYICLIQDDPAAGCVRQGCSAACVGNQDCPPGTFCDDSLTAWSSGGTNATAVCRPNPPGPDLSLSCP